MGGGPAGCTAATLVAMRGFRVALLEREKTPPFKVGESLVPYTYETFARLGIVERLKKSHFQKKAQRPVLQRFGPRVGALLLLGDGSARALHHLAGAAQRTRRASAGERGGPGRRGPPGHPGAGRALRRGPRGGRARAGGRRRRVRTPGPGRGGRDRPERPDRPEARAQGLRAASPQGVHFQPLPGRETRPRHRRGRDADHAHPEPGLLVLVHPARRRRGERRGGGRPRVPDGTGRRRPGPLRRGDPELPRSRGASRGRRTGDPGPGGAGLLLLRRADRRGRLGARRRCVRVPRSHLLDRGVARPPVGGVGGGRHR